jgi:hypothetical protein
MRDRPADVDGPDPPGADEHLEGSSAVDAELLRRGAGCPARHLRRPAHAPSRTGICSGLREGGDSSRSPRPTPPRGGRPSGLPRGAGRRRQPQDGGASRVCWRSARLGSLSNGRAAPWPAGLKRPRAGVEADGDVGKPSSVRRSRSWGLFGPRARIPFALHQALAINGFHLASIRLHAASTAGTVRLLGLGSSNSCSHAVSRCCRRTPRCRRTSYGS